MNICVKYCGGCNTRYDRKKVIEKLKKDYSSIKIITKLDNGECDFVVVLSGCMRSCINHEKSNGKYGKMIMKDMKDYQNLKSRLDKLFSKLQNMV